MKIVKVKQKVIDKTNKSNLQTDEALAGITAQKMKFSIKDFFILCAVNTEKFVLAFYCSEAYLLYKMSSL